MERETGDGDYLRGNCHYNRNVWVPAGGAEFTGYGNMPGKRSDPGGFSWNLPILAGNGVKYTKK